MGQLKRRLLYFCVLAALCFMVNAKIQKIVRGPSNTSARLNETVVLKCQIENQIGPVQWMKNGYGLATNREIPMFPRYSMIGSSSRGEYHLQIVNVTFEDDDVYECQIDATNVSISLISKPAKLSIIAEPRAPYFPGFDTSKPISVVEGQSFQLACRSDGGKPAAKLAWAIAKDEEGREVTNYLGNSLDVLRTTKVARNPKQLTYDAEVKESVLISDKTSFESAVSNLTFVPTQSEDGRYFVCYSTHDAYGASVQMTAIQLDVSYSPKVTIRVDEAQSLMQEGGKAVLHCQVDAKPNKDLTIVWYRNDRVVSSNNSNTLTVPNLRMEDHLSEIICRVRNPIGVSQSSHHLNVSFGPRIMSASQTKDVQRGDTVAFHCEALGNPEPKIQWVKKETDEVVSNGKFMTLDSAQPWHVGEYECVASVDGFEPARITSHLHLKGPPMVQFTRNMIRFERDRLILTCEVRGKPFPEHINWERNGKPIDFEAPGSRLQSQDVHRDFGMESRLTISKPTLSDYGLYNCTAQNEFGNGSMAAVVEERGILDQLRNLHVIAGIPATVLLTILTAIICIGLLAYLLFFVCRKLCGNENKGTRFSDEHSDVTIKCEALDGGNYYPEMDTSDLIITKDYISVPQNNPDLDFLPPPHFVEAFHHQRHYLNPHPIPDYAQSDASARFDPSYGSFASGHSTPAGLPPLDMYSGANGLMFSKNGPAPLETLTEVATPDTEGGAPLVNARDDIRSISRVSTHV